MTSSCKIIFLSWMTLSSNSQLICCYQCSFISWWRHQMETFSALLTICAGNSPVPGVFPTQKPVTRSFDVFFDLRLNKRSSKRWWGWWFETLSRPLWRHRNLPSTPLHLYQLSPVTICKIHLRVWCHSVRFYRTFLILNIWYWEVVTNCMQSLQFYTGLIPGLHPTNERRCYKVTPSLICWAQT